MRGTVCCMHRAVICRAASKPPTLAGVKRGRVDTDPWGWSAGVACGACDHGAGASALCSVSGGSVAHSAWSSGRRGIIAPALCVRVPSSSECTCHPVRWPSSASHRVYVTTGPTLQPTQDRGGETSRGWPPVSTIRAHARLASCAVCSTRHPAVAPGRAGTVHPITHGRPASSTASTVTRCSYSGVLMLPPPQPRGGTSRRRAGSWPARNGRTVPAPGLRSVPPRSLCR